jgi:serine/threonine protein kinase
MNVPELRDIATGAFGRVYSARLTSGATVAIKCTKAHGESEYLCLWMLGQAAVPHTISAVAALKNAGPPLLPEPCQLAIAMTHVRGTTLRENLIARAILGQPVEMPLVKQWTAQLVDFLLHLQVKLGLSHDDLKLGNIMVEAQRELRVVDFTFAGPKRPDEWHCGTVCYMPPERLFYTQRPEHVTQSGPDMWAVGVLMATMTLTAQPLGHLLTSRESFLVLDDQGRFDPSRTNTVYDLLSDREPWFSQATTSMAQSSGLDRDLVKQGVRLLLWLRSRMAPNQQPQFRFPPQADEQERTALLASPLYRLLSDNMTSICGAYDASGSQVYERVWEHMRQRMGEDLYAIWRTTQQWSPRSRGSLAELQRRLGLYPLVEHLTVHQTAKFTRPVTQDSMTQFVSILEETYAAPFH